MPQQLDEARGMEGVVENGDGHSGDNGARDRGGTEDPREVTEEKIEAPGMEGIEGAVDNCQSEAGALATTVHVGVALPSGSVLPISVHQSTVWWPS